jgi:exopolysaccharide production protein ExoZ
MDEVATSLPPSPARPERQRLDWLQWARAAASIPVAAFHTYERVRKQSIDPGVFDAFRFGYLGVDLFFVISGFIIFYIHTQDINRPDRLNLYLFKRLTRIYPIYWVLFAIALVLYFSFPNMGDGPPLDFANIVRCALLLPNPDGQIVGLAWTLVYEISFYVAFAVLILNRKIGLGLVTLWALLILTLRFGGLLDLGYFNSFFSLRYIEFGLGAAVFFLSRRFMLPWGLPIAALGLLVLFFGGLVSPTIAAILKDDIGHILAPGFLAALIIFGCVTARSSLSHTWLGRIMTALGDASYSIYLFQWLIGAIIDKAYVKLGLHSPITDLLLPPFMFVAMIVGGYVIHLMLEKPLMTLFSRWSRGRGPAKVVVSGAA